VTACECDRVRAGSGPHRDRRRLRRRPPRLPDRADGRRRAARGQSRRPPRRLQCGERGRRLLPQQRLSPLRRTQRRSRPKSSRLRRPRRCSGSTGSTTTPNLRDRPARATASTPTHLILHGDRDAVFNHEESRVLHEALSAVGAQSIYVLIAVPDMRARSSSPPRSRRRSPASWPRSSVRTPLRHRPPGSSCSHPPEPACPRGEAALRRLSRLFPGTGTPGGSEGERHD
jgi:hypothetical protein